MDSLLPTLDHRNPQCSKCLGYVNCSKFTTLHFIHYSCICYFDARIHSAYEVARNMLLNRCCTGGLFEAFYLIAKQTPQQERSTLLLNRCASCVITGEWHSARYLCNSRCCNSESDDCVNVLFFLIKNDDNLRGCDDEVDKMIDAIGNLIKPSPVKELGDFLYKLTI